MKITHFDKLSCQALEREVLEAAKNVAGKHGLSVASGGGTRSDVEFTSHMRFRIAATKPDIVAEQKLFAASCDIFNLTATDYGKGFAYNGQQFQLIGFNTTTQLPIITRNVSTGKIAVFSSRILGAL